jgi:hypothetical protein
VLGSGQPHPLGAHRRAELLFADPDLGQRPRLGVHLEVDAEARIGEAEVGVPLLGDQPPGALALGGVAEAEEDDDLILRQAVEADAAAQVPHQQRRIGLLGADLALQVVAAPGPELDDQRPQRFAGRSEAVGIPALPLQRLAGQQLRALQLSQPFAQQRGGHPRHPALQFVEAGAAHQQLAQDQQGPALGQDLGRLGDGAELSVALRHLLCGECSCLTADIEVDRLSSRA